MYDFKDVDSSNLQSIAISGNDLIIKFVNGRIYRYYGAAKEYNSLLNASSKGTYFSNNIRNEYKTQEEK